MNDPPPSAWAGQLLSAIRFAAEKHRDYRRKGVIAAPYINHPIVVAEQLARAGLEEDIPLLMAAVLHDVVEDTKTSPEELEELFGAAVAGMVMDVTDDKSLDARERKKQVVKNIASKSREAQLIKISDLIANVYDVIHYPPNWSRERKNHYFQWSEMVVGEIRGIHPALEKTFADQLAQARERMLAETR